MSKDVVFFSISVCAHALCVAGRCVLSEKMAKTSKFRACSESGENIEQSDDETFLRRAWGAVGGVA
jgi:hypothetical protein